jgi:N-acetylglucosamine kinase-like BadF-type ATPase
VTGEASSGVVLIGVDAGATKTVALAVRLDGTTVGRASGGGANPKRQGLAIAAERIASLCSEAAATDGVPVPALVFIAGAGLDRPEHARALEHAVAGTSTRRG